MVRGASHEATAHISILAQGEKTERVWYETSYDSYERTTGALPMPKGRGLRAGKEGQEWGSEVGCSLSELAGKCALSIRRLRVPCRH